MFSEEKVRMVCTDSFRWKSSQNSGWIHFLAVNCGYSGCVKLFFCFSHRKTFKVDDMLSKVEKMKGEQESHRYCPAVYLCMGWIKSPFDWQSASDRVITWSKVVAVWNIASRILKCVLVT